MSDESTAEKKRGLTRMLASRARQGLTALTRTPQTREPLPLPTLWLCMLLIPSVLATFVGTWEHTGVPLYVLAGTIAMIPGVVVVYREGWTGFFTATAIASFGGYFLYCHNVVVLGDELVSNQRFAYPALATALRNRAAWVTLLGCSGLAFGLIVTSRRKREHPEFEWLPRGPVYVPDTTLRMAIIVISVVHLGSRMYIIWRAGYNPIEALLGVRQGEYYIDLAGDAGFLAQLARVFQATALVAGVLLLARRSTIWGAKAISVGGIALVVALAALMGNRGHAVAYMLTVMAFGVMIPVPRIQRLSKALVPLGLITIITIFVFLTVYRDVGFTNLDKAEGRSLSDGFKQMLGYDQATMLEQVLYTTPERFPPLEGSSLIALPLNPIPRVLWPEKPIGLGPELAEQLGMEEHLSLSAGLIGEGYINFLLLGAGLLPLSFGLLAGFWDRIRNLGTAWPDAYGLWIAGLPGVFYSVRGDVLTGGGLFMYTTAGTLIVLVFFGKANPRRLEQAFAESGRLPAPAYAERIGHVGRARRDNEPRN